MLKTLTAPVALLFVLHCAYARAQPAVSPAMPKMLTQDAVSKLRQAAGDGTLRMKNDGLHVERPEQRKDDWNRMQVDPGIAPSIGTKPGGARTGGWSVCPKGQIWQAAPDQSGDKGECVPVNSIRDPRK